MRGIDVSHWNTGADVSRGVDFVIVKLTQGVSFVDNMAQHFIGETLKAGLCLGVYHFAANDTPEAEADFFAYKMREFGLIGKALPVLDYETVHINDSQWVERFATRFHDTTKIWPVIYTSASWCKKFNSSWISTKCKLWVAGYPSPRTGWPESTNIPYVLAPWANAIIWQFTSSLVLNGYRPLDGNIAYISPAEWAALAKGETAPAPAPAPANLSKIADEVIAGMWGNGEDRKRRLTAAGYDYAAVQKLVNQKLAPARKSIDDLAREVIAGKWGNGAARKNALTGAGYDYAAVQRRVNEMLR